MLSPLLSTAEEECGGCESWVVLTISSHISLNVKCWVEPAGLQQLWVNGWMCMEVEGWDSREGTCPLTTMLNKQRQFLPHAHGSDSELFDFPIYSFLCMQPPVGRLDLFAQLWIQVVSVEEEIQWSLWTYEVEVIDKNLCNTKYNLLSILYFS